MMEFVYLILFVFFWVVLQMWILPRFGIST